MLESFASAVVLPTFLFYLFIFSQILNFIANWYRVVLLHRSFSCLAICYSSLSCRHNGLLIFEIIVRNFAGFSGKSFKMFLFSLCSVAKYQNEDVKRAIIRLEQNAHSYMQRSIASHGAFAILYGRHSKHYLKKPEVVQCSPCGFHSLLYLVDFSQSHILLDLLRYC